MRGRMTSAVLVGRLVTCHTEAVPVVFADPREYDTSRWHVYSLDHFDYEYHRINASNRNVP